MASENCLNHVIINTVVEILLDDPDSEGKGDDGEDPVEDREGGDHGKNDKEEPEEDKDLLIDDVEGKNAHAVMFSHCSRWSIHVKCALGHLKNI